MFVIVIGLRHMHAMGSLIRNQFSFNMRGVPCLRRPCPSYTNLHDTYAVIDLCIYNITSLESEIYDLPSLVETIINNTKTENENLLQKKKRIMFIIYD